MKPIRLLFLMLVVACGSATTKPKLDPSALAAQKIAFDLSRLDEDGLRGPADGKVAVSYEFAIPNTVRHKAEVKAIDATVEFMPGSRGRIGAGPDECLCIGSTHQQDYRKVLERLAALEYVEKIIECHFE